MRKIAILFLLLIILGSFSFVFLKWAAHGNEKNYFNTHLRPSFSKYHTARQILGLHYDGDAAADYLGNYYPGIIMEVDSMVGLNTDSDFLNNLAKNIENTTGKKVTLRHSDTDIPYASTISSEQASLIKRKYSDYQKPEENAVLYILLASQKEESPEDIGSTLEEDGLVIYAGTINRYALNNSEKSNQYAMGTILHEFGHQLGLAHNDLPECLMNPTSDFGSMIKTRDITIDFCDYEKNILKEKRL